LALGAFALFAAPTLRDPAPAFPFWPANNYYNYSFLHPELNSIQFYNRSAVEPFFKKLQNAYKKRVTILHIGDSHVQADGFTGEVREQLQQTFGYGGRGMVFPYSTGHTHAAVDYFTDHTGRWIYAKNIEALPPLSLGASGITSKTYDKNASFRLHFRNTIKPEFRKLRIFCKRNASSYDLRIKTARQEINVDVYDAQKEGPAPVNVVDVTLEEGENEMSFYLQQTDSAQSEFEIYGISIENPVDKGVLFHSVGINGAGFYSLLRENLLEEQLHYIAPDAVIIDVGANDFYRGGLNQTEFTSNMSKMVDILRRYNKEITIIFSCSQDIYRGGYSLPECAVYSDLIASFSKANNTAFYDWYWIAGGRYSMLKWNSSMLSNRDLVHLSGQGYKLKGQLIAEAYEKTYEWLLANDTTQKLVYNIDSLAHPPVDSAALKNQVATTVQYKWIYHRVVRGQTIFSVANYYGVTAYQIKVWNRLRNNYLWIGQLLKVYAPYKVAIAIPQNPVTPITNVPKDTVKKQTIPPAPKPQVQPKPQVLPAKPSVQRPAVVVPKPIYHKVKSGETLFGLARKYNTSTTALQRLNNMRGTSLRIGQVLRVK